MAFPTWLILSLISPVFWAIVHVLDSYCVNKVFERPWIGPVASAFTMLISFPVLLCGLFITGWVPLSFTAVLLCMIAGLAFMASQLAYFYALSCSESGIVAAYWNLLPLFLLLVGYGFLGERFTAARYAGCMLLVVGSVSFCMVDGNLQHRVMSFWLMFTGAWLQVVYFLTLKHLFSTSPVYPSFLVVTLAMIIAGILPLVLRRRRRVFQSNWPEIFSVLPFLLVIEAANLTAVLTSQYAVSFGPPSLVASVEACIPAVTFLLSLLGDRCPSSCR